MQFLLLFEHRKIGDGAGRFLLAERQLLLGRREIGRCGVEYLLVTVQFFLQRREPTFGLRQLCFGGGGAHHQFRRALFVGADTRLPAIAFDRDLVKPLAVLSRLGLDRVSALGALGMFFFRFVHAFGL